MKKLIVVDIDGTLLNSNNIITNETKESLLKAQKQGHIIVISSGRSPSGVEKYAKLLNLELYNGLISTYNGAKVIKCKSNEIIFNHLLDLELTKEILSYGEDIGLNYMLYVDDKILTNSTYTYSLKETSQRVGMDYEVIEDLSSSLNLEVNKILFTDEKESINKKSRLIKDKFGAYTSQLKSTPYFYEIMAKNIDKGKSLMEISGYLKIAIGNSIAFGDQENDIEMLNKAGIGIAMNNAPSIVKKNADYITKSNDENGIAYYINNYVLD